MARRLAVMAHWDPRGLVAPHVRRQVTALASACSSLVVVSTAALTPASRSFLASHGRLIERANEGYDFFSYRAGLLASDLAAYDEVVVCNDTYVPLVPYADVFAAMADSSADFWGLTESARVSPHVPSFFVAFRRPALKCPAFDAFWSGMVPISDRARVIRRYEVGLSTALYAGGLASGAFFTPSAADRRLARRRVWWWQLGRLGVPRSRSALALLRSKLGVPWNPAIALADRGLPFTKVDTLRYDPYGLDAGRLLTWGERRHPEAFDGVRAWLAETAPSYPPRAAEALRPVPSALRPLGWLVRYADG